MLNTDADDAEGIPLVSILDQWVLLEFDFQRILGIRLEQERRTLSWRAFINYAAGLFGVSDSLVRNHFRPDPEPGAGQPSTMEDA